MLIKIKTNICIRTYICVYIHTYVYKNIRVFNRSWPQLLSSSVYFPLLLDRTLDFYLGLGHSEENYISQPFFFIAMIINKVVSATSKESP